MQNIVHWDMPLRITVIKNHRIFTVPIQGWCEKYFQHFDAKIWLAPSLIEDLASLGLLSHILTFFANSHHSRWNFYLKGSRSLAWKQLVMSVWISPLYAKLCLKMSLILLAVMLLQQFLIIIIIYHDSGNRPTLIKKRKKKNLNVEKTLYQRRQFYS